MLKPNISAEKLKWIFSDPVLSDETLFLYFIADRDPTASEPVIDAIGIPLYWPFWWWNIVTNQWFLNQIPTSGAMVWGKCIFDKNILTSLSDQGWTLNTSRNYSASGISLNSSRRPSTTNDTFVVASVNLVNTLLTTTIVICEISPDNSTWTTVGQIADITGVASNKTLMISFSVPTSYYYRFISSGTGTINLTSCNELLL